MTRRPNFHWLALIAIAVVMGILLSVLTYVRGEAVLAVARPLVDSDLPTLRAIAELKGIAADCERIAHEFYNTTDRERFRGRSADIARAVGPRMEQLSDSIDDSEGRRQLDDLRGLQRTTEELLLQLDQAIGESRVDIAAIRSAMNAVTSTTTTTGERLDILASGIQARGELRGEQTRTRLGDIIRLVAWFSGLLVVATLVIGYFLAAYLREAHERRRLALFPERNPYPVISIDATGAISYANPGAMAMTESLRLSSPQELLPQDLPARLGNLRDSTGGGTHWEYPLHDRVLGITLHCLEDLGTCHVYLSDITERQRAEAQLEYLAYHDVLTSLPNRRKFETLLADAVKPPGRGTVVLVSIDRYQNIIKTLGHGVADEVLRQLAERLLPFGSRHQAACCIHRFDAELFAALLPDIVNPGDVSRFCERVADALSAPLVADGREMYFSSSLGVACYPLDGTSVGELLRNADMALQEARRVGGRTVVRYAPAMNARALERLEIEHSLRRAIVEDEFELHYQPQVETGSQRIIGLEALIRWRHPTKGMISPAEFIPIAEETGLVIDIGHWVLASACAQARAWKEAGLPLPVMAINISPRQFADPELQANVRQAILLNELAPDLIELEITEGAAMQDVDSAIACLHEFKSMGVRLSIDDFGTGYSSLSYLKRLPIDKLKIDQSFVRNMTEDAGDAAIVRSVIALGRSLGLGVIAEGVETEMHRRRLAEFGCAEFQGYLFSRPLAAEAVTRMLERQAADTASVS